MSLWIKSKYCFSLGVTHYKLIVNLYIVHVEINVLHHLPITGQYSVTAAFPPTPVTFLGTVHLLIFVWSSALLIQMTVSPSATTAATVSLSPQMLAVSWLWDLCFVLKTWPDGIVSLSSKFLRLLRGVASDECWVDYMVVTIISLVSGTRRHIVLVHPFSHCHQKLFDRIPILRLVHCFDHVVNNDCIVRCSHTNVVVHAYSVHYSALVEKQWLIAVLLKVGVLILHIALGEEFVLRVSSKASSKSRASSWCLHRNCLGFVENDRGITEYPILFRWVVVTSCFPNIKDRIKL